MKPSINKIRNWTKTKNALPAVGRLCILQDKDDVHLFYIGELYASDEEVRFLFNSDNQGGCSVSDIIRWAYIDLNMEGKKK